MNKLRNNSTQASVARRWQKVRGFAPGFRRRSGQCCRSTVALLVLLVLSASPTSAQLDSPRNNAVKHLRGPLEEPFLAAGGFSEFDCSITSGARPSQPFTCNAGMATGEQYQYLLVPDPAKGVIVNLVTEPASQLNYVWLPAMEAACKQFLENFNQADWEKLYASLDPSLQEIIPVTSLETDLSGVRQLLGTTGEATLETYSVRDGGRNELQYSVPSQNGTALFRCGLLATENTMTILAYLIAPYPDSPLYKSSLEALATQQLSELIGKQVTALEIPYAQLLKTNDVAFGIATLANGDSVDFRVVRSGRTDDFSQYDYTFAVPEVHTP